MRWRALHTDLHVCGQLCDRCQEKKPNWGCCLQGPERSGSSFHKDPNSTSAWNAVLRGSKKWILYPPHVTPPGKQVPGRSSHFLLVWHRAQQSPTYRERACSHCA